MRVLWFFLTPWVWRQCAVLKFWQKEKDRYSRLCPSSVNEYSGACKKSALSRKFRATIWSRDSTRGHMFGENSNCKRFMHPNVHCSNIYNSQDMETTARDRGINTECEVCLYNGISLSHKKEWDNTICSNVNEPRHYHTKWSNSDKYHMISYDCSPPGSSVCGILQAKVLEWVAIPFSRGSFWPRDRIWYSWIVDRFFTIWATKEAAVLSNQRIGISK